LRQVVSALSAFADHALDTAIRTAIAERYPGAGVAGIWCKPSPSAVRKA
jgi:hypothetical protein